jgi:hypothetical protein
METIKKQMQSAIEFIVHHEDTNDNSALHLCKILHEVTAIYDQFVILTFGDLSYYTVLNSSYHLDITGQAKKGDLVRLESKAAINPGLWLDINIVAYRAGRKENVIATGRFVFELKKINETLPMAPTVPEYCYEDF